MKKNKHLNNNGRPRLHFFYLAPVDRAANGPGGVAQSTSNPHREQKTRVRNRHEQEIGPICRLRASAQSVTHEQEIGPIFHLRASAQSVTQEQQIGPIFHPRATDRPNLSPKSNRSAQSVAREHRPNSFTQEQEIGPICHPRATDRPIHSVSKRHLTPSQSRSVVRGPGERTAAKGWKQPTRSPVSKKIIVTSAARFFKLKIWVNFRRSCNEDVGIFNGHFVYFTT
jgi:hypothetical protein